MTLKEKLRRLIDGLPESELQTAERFLEYLHDRGSEPSATEREDKSWLEADLGGPLPPYDWGPDGPPEGKPVRYVPGVGLVVEGGKSHGK